MNRRILWNVVGIAAVICLISAPITASMNARLAANSVYTAFRRMAHLDGLQSMWICTTKTTTALLPKGTLLPHELGGKDCNSWGLTLC